MVLPEALFGRHEPAAPEPLWAPPEMAEPVEPEEEPRVSPLAAPLHVRSGSALVRVDNGVLLVEREGEARFERPIELVSAVHKRARIYEGVRLEQIARAETLAEVWGRVRANKGGPSDDGVTINDLATGIELSLEDLSKKLLAESYRPKKLRHAFITKASGGKRPLSIPMRASYCTLPS